jgi:hypothetical protein
MEERIYRGSIPDQLDIRLERRDALPLPADALVRFQLINRGKSSRPNYHWVLYNDGRWFLARNVGGKHWQVPFDTDLPAEPTRRFQADVVDEVKEQLQRADFLSQAPYQENRTVRDGGYIIVTARVEERVHEVIYVATRPPLVEFLTAIASTHEWSESSGETGP